MKRVIEALSSILLLTFFEHQVSAGIDIERRKQLDDDQR